MQNTTLNTPYFHILETDLDRDVSLLKQSLTDSWGNWIVGYSVKTNSLPWLLCYMKEQGFYAEIVSDTEYRLAKRLGFPDSHMIYNGPVKDRQIFTDILLAGGLVNLDSSEEPQWLSELSARFPDRLFSVGVRVNCDIASLCPEEVLVEEEGGRFGYCYENGALAGVIRALNALPNVRLAGLHLHSSTQSRTVNVYAALARMAAKIAREYDLKLSYVDMGGGYFGGRDDKPDYRDYFRAICRELCSKGNRPHRRARRQPDLPGHHLRHLRAGCEAYPGPCFSGDGRKPDQPEPPGHPPRVPASHRIRGRAGGPPHGKKPVGHRLYLHGI